jgi:hypothetical protein
MTSMIGGSPIDASGTFRILPTVHSSNQKSLKQYLCAEYVCSKEFFRGSDAAVYMGFSGRINNCFGILIKCSAELIRVSYIAHNKAMARSIYPMQVVGISGVGQCIIIDDLERISHQCKT